MWQYWDAPENKLWPFSWEDQNLRISNLKFLLDTLKWSHFRQIRSRCFSNLGLNILLHLTAILVKQEKVNHRHGAPLDVQEHKWIGKSQKKITQNYAFDFPDKFTKFYSGEGYPLSSLSLSLFFSCLSTTVKAILRPLPCGWTLPTMMCNVNLHLENCYTSSTAVSLNFID